MKERILSLSLHAAIELFQGIKWKLFSIEEAGIKIEVPRAARTGESMIVNLPYSDQAGMGEIVSALEEAGFIEQRVRVVSDY